MENKLCYLFCMIVILVISTVLHELAHGWMAYALGDDTAKSCGRLSLNPLKHIDPVMSIIMPAMFALLGMPILAGAKPVPINTNNVRGGEWGFALVAIAGPLTNFVLAFLSYVLVGVFATHGMGFWADFAFLALSVNLGFMLFNLIPIPPLDGSRVLYALAPDCIKRLMEKMESMGLMVIYMLLLFGGTVLSSYMISAETGILNFFQAILPFA